MDETQGALNTAADALPADSPAGDGFSGAAAHSQHPARENSVSGSEDASAASLNTSSHEGESAAPMAADQSADPAADQSADKIEDKKLPETIPYAEFQKQVHKRQEYERQVAEMTEAANLGLHPQQYQQAKQEASQFGFPDVPSYLVALQQQQQIHQEIQTLSERADLTQEAKQELIAAKQERLAVQQEMLKVRQINQQLATQTLEATLSHARKELGLQELPANMERIFRLSPPNVVGEMVSDLKSLLSQQTNNKVAEYALQKQQDRATPAPEARGGNPPAPTGAPKNWKEAVSRPFTDLIFGSPKA